MSNRSLDDTNFQEKNNHQVSMPLCIGSAEVVRSIGPSISLICPAIRRLPNLPRGWNGKPLLTLDGDAPQFSTLFPEVVLGGHISAMFLNFSNNNKALVVMFVGVSRSIMLVMDAYGPDTQIAIAYWKKKGFLNVGFMSPLGGCDFFQIPYEFVIGGADQVAIPPGNKAEMWTSTALLPHVKNALKEMHGEINMAFIAVQEFTLLDGPGPSSLRKTLIP